MPGSSDAWIFMPLRVHLSTCDITILNRHGRWNSTANHWVWWKVLPHLGVVCGDSEAKLIQVIIKIWKSLSETHAWLRYTKFSAIKRWFPTMYRNMTWYNLIQWHILSNLNEKKLYMICWFQIILVAGPVLWCQSLASDYWQHSWATWLPALAAQLDWRMQSLPYHL